MEQYKERLLNSPNSKKVIDSIFAAALNDDHKNQGAAWKIITDRIIPLGLFEKVAGGAQRSAIQINITGIGSPSVSSFGTQEAQEADIEADIEDAEWTPEPTETPLVDPLGHSLGGPL
jgi:hypothetical protein